MYASLNPDFHVSYHCSPPGDVAGQFTPASPTCPGGTFTFTCTVIGGVTGLTTWRVGGSSECVLVHRSTSLSVCGPGLVFTANSGAEFGPGTSATSFTSTLSGTATPSLNGTLVECFGPANNVNAGNLVGNSNLKILGVFLLTRSSHWYILHDDNLSEH